MLMICGNHRRPIVSNMFNLPESLTPLIYHLPPIEKNLDVKIVTSLYENIKKNSHHSQHIPDKEAVDTFLLCLLYNAMW